MKILYALVKISLISLILPYQVMESIQIGSYPMQLSSAITSDGVDVVDTLRYAQQGEVILTQGNYLDLEFSMDPAELMSRVV